MSRSRLIPARAMLILALVAGLLPRLSGAQDSEDSRALRRDHYTSGQATLNAFAPVSEATCYSIVKLNVDGATVALATVVDANGLALTKASELKKGKLTCWLATEKEVDAELIATDEEEDVALVRVHAGGLKRIRWATGEVAIGQWAITPGIAATPQAVGIISALPHRVRPPRALIGVSFDYRGSQPRIQSILPGLGAEQAGLKSGDLILAVNGNAVTNREQIVETLREFREGRHVKLRIQRLETEFTVTVRMMSPKAGQFEDDPFSPRRLGRLGGEVSQRSEGFEQAIEHDTVLQPWLCGGPLVDLDGKAIGINIARASRVSTYALPARLVKQILDNLKTKAKSSASAGKSNSPHGL
jgi:serine protease Do